MLNSGSCGVFCYNFAKRHHKTVRSNRSASNVSMRAAAIVRPIEPPVGDDEVARRLHEELHDGEEFDMEQQNHQTIVLRMTAAVSTDATKHVVRRLNNRRGSRVRELVNIFKVLYEAIVMDELMEDERVTRRVRKRMANRLVQVATELVQVTTIPVVHSGTRADEREEIYENLIADAQYLRNNVVG